MKITPYLVLTLLVVTWCSVLPTPYCKSRPLYSHFPLTINETVVADLGYAFSGYNLDFRIDEGAEFASVRPKMEVLSFKNYNFTEIISMKVSHQGNRWGDSMFVLSNDHGQTTLHFGSFKNHTVSPDLEVATVEYRDDAHCFDALLYHDQGYAIVDCIELIDKVWTNKFFYINLSTREREAEIVNEMYANFDRHTRRRMFRYHDPHNGLEYIIRAYMSHDNNSYIEFFHSSDIHEIEILRVFDRTSLGLKQFNIADIQVYLGDIFVLDYYTGLYRLDILKGQAIEITGHYPVQHYTKFSLYSDDLDEQLLLVLANNHAIYQINIDRISEPYLLTKYTIPSNSYVHKISVDSKFLIVQSSSNVSSEKGQYMISNYTYIFTKGSRTFMNAYKVVEHGSWNVHFDYDRVERRLMFAAEENVTNYKLNDASVLIFQNNSAALGTNKTFTITAISTDPHSDKVATCNSSSEVAFVASNDKSIYPTDLPLPSVYYANYPGQIRINLRNYALGPNITYNITDNSKLQTPPVFWLNQQNQSVVTFDKNPIKANNLEFFWAEVFPHRGNNTIFYFYQETNNNFHVARCEHYYNDILIECKQLMTQSYRHKMKSFTSVPFMMQGSFHLYYAITLEDANSVYIHDNGHDRIAALDFPTGYEGTIGDVEASNGFLYVCFPYIKTIRVYKMSRCQDFTCPVQFELNVHTMTAAGVKYFNPIDLITSRFHPEVIFIKNLGSLIIIDIDNHQNIILLTEITDSKAVMVNGFQVAVHEEYLVLVASPNIIEEYHMGQLYSSKNITFLKNLQLYQYKLDTDFDLEFSDYTNLFYLEAVDTTTNLTTVLVYKIGSLLVNSLYDVINLPGRYRHNNLLIEICGFEVDYVNIVSSQDFMVYRQFPEPTLIIEDTFEDFKLDVLYYNTQNNKSLATLNFSIVNYPQAFNTTKVFEQEIRGKLKLTNQGQYTWDTRKWFEGHIVGFNSTSNDSKVRLIDQIYEKGEINVRGTDFVDSNTGGYAIAEDLVKFYYNGSVNKVILIPDQQQGEICLRLATRYDDLFSVTGCQHYSGGVNIYFTSEANLKGFSWGPFITEAHYLRNLQMVHYMLVVTDTDEPGIFMQRGGTIFLYALNLDPVTENQMDLIEEIDSNDFFGAHGWDNEDAYLGNAHLTYDEQDDAYRLYVTEMYNGLFVIEFNHTFGHNEIQVLATNFIDLNKILEENDFHMPVDAHFLAVTFMSEEYNPHLEVESILVTTNKYHNFEFQVVYDDNAQVIACHLHRVYYRYGWYEAANIVKAEEDYVSIPYIIPDIYSNINPNYSKQYIVVYDAKEYDKDHAKGYSERYMLGGFKINNTVVGGYGFNVTYDSMHNGTRTGLVTIDVRDSKMHENSLSRNITVEADEGYETGRMQVKAYNDFHSETFEIFYEAHNKGNKLQTWEIILIVVSCVVFALLCGYLFFLCWKRRQEKPVDEARVSLMESEVGAALLRHGEPGSERGSLPETHFRSTQNFETQTESYVPPKLPVQNLEAPVEVEPNAEEQKEDPREYRREEERIRVEEGEEQQREEEKEEQREDGREQRLREEEAVQQRQREQSRRNADTEEVRLPQSNEEQAPEYPPAPISASAPIPNVENPVEPPAEGENQ